MDLLKFILLNTFLELANSLVVKNSDEFQNNTDDEGVIKVDSPDNVFNGVYTECFLHLSYSCLQKKTLLYLKELNNLSEVSVIGDYVKFVKVNTTIISDDEDSDTGNSDELAFLIDKAVDAFFDNHILKFNALGRDISIPRNLDEFVGRKKRKGGGGGGGEGMMGGHGHDDKKKMMMMAMMCMKMKLMMMVPAMMGMMGMMSFKGMMFSMMSFMISKMMLLMKILEKRGGAGGFGGGGGGGDGGWAAAGGGGGGAWMPAGGQDFGNGGGYDANGQWQSRSIAESLDILNKPTVYYTHINNREKDVQPLKSNKEDADKDKRKFKYNTEFESPKLKAMPEISYIKPIVRLNNKIETDVYKKPVLVYKKSNVIFNSYGEENSDSTDLRNDDEKATENLRAKRSIVDLNNEALSQDKINRSETLQNIQNFKESFIKKSRNIKEVFRKKRSILDLLQNSYAYWMTKLLGINNNRRTNLQKYKIINGVRYVYYPFKAQKAKMPKEVQLTSQIKYADEVRPIIAAEDFNKGEIMEGAIEARTLRKRFKEMKEEVNAVNDTLEDNPWA